MSLLPQAVTCLSVLEELTIAWFRLLNMLMVIAETGGLETISYLIPSVYGPDTMRRIHVNRCDMKGAL